VRSHAATRDAARDTVEWARECEQRGAGELLVWSLVDRRDEPVQGAEPPATS